MELDVHLADVSLQHWVVWFQWVIDLQLGELLEVSTIGISLPSQGPNLQQLMSI
jgi:hypothetical protein